MHCSRCLLKYRQEAPGIKEKVQLTIARLGRFGMEDDSVRDEYALKRKMSLFEYVMLVYHMPMLTLMLPQSSGRNKG